MGFMSTAVEKKFESMRALPGDDTRQILWRFAGRYDLQMLVQSARAVARGPVAKLVAAGARNTHEWTPAKAALLKAFDEAGITAVYMEPDEGGFIEGPKNLALALVAFELAWVDAGSATGSLAGCLALSPIHERGTAEQKKRYMSLAAPPAPGEDREPWRGAFALTEPLPYVGVETGMLGGKVRIAEWKEGGEPVLQVDKRGRFITNMGFANFVTAAVESDDPRIKGTCMVILEQDDPGIFDRGTPTRKLVHQLSSTNDPVFSLRVPASRIIGGYSVKDGQIVPRYNHGEIIEAVFRRTRVTVGIMTSAKLLSAVEPVIRYQRGRFRGGEGTTPGTPRYDLGLQLKQDTLHRLVDVWATGEASASLGFAAARTFDELDPLEREKARLFAEQGIGGGTGAMRAMKKVQKEALEYLKNPQGEPAPLVRFALADAVANVLCPACKLWNTGHGATMMREAVSLMGGYGITEDCPGFLGHKWMDSQLEATYEGPEAVQRRQLSITMTDEVFLAQYRRLHPGHRHADVAVDPRTPAKIHRRLWRQALPQRAPGCDFPAGRCAVLAAGRSLADSGRAGTRAERPREPRGGRRPGRRPHLPDRPLPRRDGARRGRSGAHLRRARARLPAPPGVGFRSLYELLHKRRPGSARGHDARHFQPGARLHRRDRGGRLACRQGRPVRRFRRPGPIRPPAGAPGWLPDRFTTGQRPRRGSLDQGHDPRGAGLLAVKRCWYS
jgi:alkylation response protein AidB-like acyl-CoA dehydrogenase